MSRLNNTFKANTQAQLGSVAQNRWGIVESYDADKHAAKVRIMPEDRLSGWLPIINGMVGEDMGFWIAPVPGQQAFLASQEGSTDAYVIVGFAFSDTNRVPQVQADMGGSPVKLEPGQFAIKAQGMVIRISEGKLLIECDTEVQIKTGKVRMEADLEVDGYVKATGNVESEAEVKDKQNTLDHLRDAYNDHLHPVGVGSPFTKKTTKPDS